MEDCGEGKVEAEAEAEVPTGTAAMKIALMVVAVTVEGMMMIGITTKVGERGIEAQVLVVGGAGAGAQVARGIIVLLGKEVKRGEPKLSNGIGRGKRQNVLTIPILVSSMIKTRKAIMGTCITEISTIARSHHSRVDMGIDDIISGGVQVYNSVIWNMRKKNSALLCFSNSFLTCYVCLGAWHALELLFTSHFFLRFNTLL